MQVVKPSSSPFHIVGTRGRGVGRPQRVLLAFETDQFDIRVIGARDDGRITDPAIREAQRLRFRIFALEMGADVGASAADAIDEDRFDAHCDHLVIRDRTTRRVVGTYRILPPQAARRVGYYADGEFTTDRLGDLKSGLVEFGRSCTDPAYRQGPVIMLLWTGLARYMAQSGHEHVIGCASIDARDGGRRAAALYRQLSARHGIDEAMRVIPREPLPLDLPSPDDVIEAPPLVKGYLRLGARICGEPAWDRGFQTADLFMLLSMSRMNPRYARHFGIGDVAERRAA